MGWCIGSSFAGDCNNEYGIKGLEVIGNIYENKELLSSNPQSKTD